MMQKIVTTHKNTDFDALASLIGATLIYPDVKPVIPKQVNPNVKAFMSIHKDIFTIFEVNDVDPELVSQLIIVDTNAWSRLDPKLKGLKDSKSLEVINWDHHMGAGSDIDATVVVKEKIGATITLLIREMIKQEIELTPMQATLFLAGLYEDTGSLTFTSTTSEDAYAAAFLLENKADLNIVSQLLKPAYGEKQKAILFDMLKKVERTRINGHVIGFSTIDLNSHVDRLAIVVRMYQEIINVDAAFGIFINTNRKKTIVIGRSTSDDLNIGEVMKSLGGGGHPGAGSAQLTSVNPLTVTEMITDLISGNQQASVQVGDLMSFPVFTIPPTEPMNSVAKLLEDKGCTGFPVVEKGKLVGMISRRDFKKVKKNKNLHAPVKAFMKTPVLTIAPGESLKDATRLMVRHDVGRLPVIENNSLIGIVTRSDTMLYFYDLLPE